MTAAARGLSAALAVMMLLCVAPVVRAQGSPPAAMAPPPNGQQLVAAAIATLRIDKTTAATAQFAPLRAAMAPQPGQWVACVQVMVHGAPGYFAVFLTDGKVETLRRAVAIDRCAQQRYSAPAPAKPKPSKRGGRPPRATAP